MSEPTTHGEADSNFVETMQSLIVAFVVAMTFRAFVTEGFVIPTGSMAPTLLGQHLDFRSPETGWRYAVGFDASVGLDPAGQAAARERMTQLADPLLGPFRPGSGFTPGQKKFGRAGDRILINKLYYSFFEPKRFDVVVFKNPTNPNGSDGNFIKRLVGLPNESLWLVDGDVFTTTLDRGDDFTTYRIQRKPDHVQRAVWQPIFRGLHLPPDIVGRADANPLHGPGWSFDGIAYRHAGGSDGPAALEWNKDSRRLLTDWASYNQLSRTADAGDRFVCDFRIAGTVIPENDGTTAAVELEVRDTQYRFEIVGDQARLRMRPLDFRDVGPEEGWTGPAPVRVAPLTAGRPVRIECWHVDQRMVLWIDGRQVLEHAYEWTPRERLERKTGMAAGGDDVDALVPLVARQVQDMAMIRWSFEGGPVALERAEIDRDLHYAAYDPFKLPFSLRSNPARPDLGELRVQHGYGCHPTTLARLESDQFYMLGDNTLASSDSRAWGSPHPIVAEQIDPAAFVVHRSLLLGKAWVVYFPALHPIRPGGRGFIPNFGDLRFIR
jgi:signal peptidase I